MCSSLSIDSTNYVPLYVQIKNHFIEKIEGGMLKPGDMIPSEKELCVQFNVSRITVNTAIKILVNEGYVYRMKGKGTFIAVPKHKFDAYNIVKFAETLPADHKTLSSRFVRASKEILAKLELPEKSRVLHIVRLKLLDNEPLIIENSYLPENICKDISTQKIKDSYIHAILKEKYQTLHKASIFFEPVLANQFQAKHLKVDIGAPLLYCERLTFSEYDTPVELSRGFVRGDKCRFFLKYP